MKNRQNGFQTGRVLIFSAAHMIHDIYSAFLAPLLPILIVNLSISKVEAGLLAVYIQAPSLIQPVIGHWADRRNLSLVVCIAPTFSAIIMSWLGLIPNYLTLAFLLILAGINSAGIHAIGPVLVGNFSGKSLGRGMSLWMVGGELARTVGPLLIVSAIHLLTLEKTPYLLVIGLLFSITSYVQFRNVSFHSHPHQNQYSLITGLRQMHHIMIPLAAIIFVRSFLAVSLTLYLPTFLTEEGSNLWYAGASLSVLEGAGVFGALLGGSLSDLFGRRYILLISMSCAPLFLFLFLHVQGIYQIFVLLAVGFVLLATTPVLMALVQENFPKNRALANGSYMALNFVIRSIVTVLVGGLGDFIGLRHAFEISAVVMILGIPVLFFLPDRKGGVNKNRQV